MSEYEQFKVNNTYINHNVCTQPVYDSLVTNLHFFPPQNLFEELAKELLLVILLPSRRNEFTFVIQNRPFGFVFQRNYSGLMANKKVDRDKKGLFDFKIRVGNSLTRTHFLAMEDLIRHSSLSNCEEVWQGAHPKSISKTLNELFALVELLLMMFEQEINWGNEIFQAYSAFSPIYNAKPRDMLMGFTRMAFTHSDVNAIPNWKKDYKGIKTTPDFGGKYKEYDITLKRNYFNCYRNSTNALMQGTIKSYFIEVSNLFVNNPKFK
ncbi:hypothetical protein [Priestia megaterium]|uniref:hypothetical protein n=1 Tax=Priestia megaterium TaxID=1404 RepID=UPI002D806A00|nr:hypothetical protein [Priestia megaterium]MEB4887661.1 hypothetical protein [Priestia megaterium]